MRHVVMYSGGVTSFFAARWVIEQYGTHPVTLLFADTRMEDADLYRFLVDSTHFLSVPLTRIADGRTPWQVFADEHFLGNSRIDPCSRILKRQLLNRWVKANCLPGETVLYWGLTWEEKHRALRLAARQTPWACRFPLCEKPWKTKNQWLDELQCLGLRIPRLYSMGFPHNNCGGACVKAGQAQWARLFEVMPERYLWHEQQEERLRQRLGDVSILRTRQGGMSTPLSLRQFRTTYLSGARQVDSEAWGGCGCAVDIGEEEE